MARTPVLLVALALLACACVPAAAAKPARRLLGEQCPSTVGDAPGARRYCVFCGTDNNWRYSCILAGDRCWVGNIGLPYCDEIGATYGGGCASNVQKGGANYNLRDDGTISPAAITC